MAYGAILGQTNTTYTKDQILSSSDATLLGLPSTATPADMFNVLATAGDLYVWRRTKQISDEIPEIPAGYTLGDVQNDMNVSIGDNTVWRYGTSISVANDGSISINSPSEVTLGNSSSDVSKMNVLPGKFATLVSANLIPPLVDYGEYWYFPPDSVPRHFGFLQMSKRQQVFGYPYTPAVPPGTYTDYPVSVNPNAYQTGSDEQPAGYTLGEVQSGEALVREFYTNANYFYSDSVSVSDDGTVSLSSAQSFSYNIQVPGQDVSAFDVVKGKFFSVAGAPSPFNGVVFIPVDTQFSVSTGGVGDGLKVNQYQPVTGYPAIPAGTTIEYLGKLGDKSMVQIVSYVGTGTYGESNPCSITADFPIKLAIYLGNKSASGRFLSSCYKSLSNNIAIPSLWPISYTSGYGIYQGSGSLNESWFYGKKNADGTNLSWYLTSAYPENQLNTSGYTYYFLCQG